jgi:hypothetical protein
MMKEKMSDEIAELLCTYFLMQKVKPGTDEDTVACVNTIHRLLFLTVQIKQQVNLKVIEEFHDTWHEFKDLFHPDLECQARIEETYGKFPSPPPVKGEKTIEASSK